LSFFFSSRRRHTRSKRDWSSDVCSSDLWTMVTRPRTMPLCVITYWFARVLFDQVGPFIPTAKHHAYLFAPKAPSKAANGLSLRGTRLYSENGRVSSEARHADVVPGRATYRGRSSGRRGRNEG